MQGVEFIRVESVETLKTLNFDDYVDQIILDCRWFNVDETYKRLALKLNMLHEKQQIFIVVVKDKPMFHELESRCRQHQNIVQKLIIACPELSDEELLESGKLLKSAYNIVADLPKIFRMHPLLKRKLKGKMKGKKDHGNELNELSNQCVSTQKAGNSRSTKRSVFNRMKKFQAEANKRDTEESSESFDEIEETGNASRTLFTKCYVCKTRLFDIEMTFCKPCFDLNDQLLKAKTPLHKRYAIVTGGRIKIGLYISLRLLRDGCNVIVTTRFPNCARNTYSKLPDYDEWKDRIQFKKLDLMNMHSVQEFILWTKSNLPHLDILINNAAQTIWRPSKYFNDLQQQENQLALTNTNSFDNFTMKRKHNSNQKKHSDDDSEAISSATEEPLLKKHKASSDTPTIDIVSKPSTSSYKANGNDLFHNPVNNNSVWFPHGLKGDDGQQLDLRPMNSWRLKLTDIPFSELLQVLTVNSVAPFVLISQLKPLLLASPFERKFIVNVSAMEGQFSRFNKGPHHVHTNMAKAALNMLTRTTGIEFEPERIYMTAVDTGWCTDERPYEQAQYEKEKGFRVPLTEEDGAARVYHPIHHGMNENNKPYFAVFLKDYKIHHW